MSFLLPRSRARVLAGGLCLLGLLGCMRKAQTETLAAAAVAEIPVVRVAPPTLRDLDHTLEITAEVVPLRDGNVAAEVPGLRILELLVDVGDAVSIRQILARLDATDLEQAVDEAELAEIEAEVKVTEADWAVKELEAELEGQERTIARKRQMLERTRQQAEKGALAVDDLEAAQYDVDVATASGKRLELQIEKAKVALALARHAKSRAGLDLKEARKELERAEVRAPFSGIISERRASLGATTSMGEPLYRLFDPQSLVVEAQVPQRELTTVREGQAVTLRADAFAGLALKGSVVLVAPTVDEVGTVTVRFKIDREATLASPLNRAVLEGPAGDLIDRAFEEHGVLKPGLFVSGRIVLATHEDVLTVARKAVGYHRMQPFLYVAERDAADAGLGTVRRLYFKEGLGEDGTVEVVPISAERTLAAGDLVVLVGQDRLKEGDRVRLEVAEPEPSDRADAAAAPPSSPGNGK